MLKKAIIRALVYDSVNNLWIGSTYGLIKYNLTKNIYTLYTKNPNDSNSLNSNYIWSIFIDNFDNLWVGTHDGLCKLNKNSNNFVRYIFKVDNKVDYLDNLITCINQDHKNIIWVGTYSSGIHKIEPKYTGNSLIPGYDNSNILHFEIPGLFKECVDGILEDENHNLWVCSDKGITRINAIRDNFKTYNTKDGLSSNEFSTGTYYSRNGEFFFGGSNGMVSFIPGMFKENESIPNISLTSFKIFNDLVYSGVEASDLNNIELSYKQNEFSFSFAVFDFTEISNNQYKYKLEGFDKDWIDCGNKNEVTFMNLNGGEYTFRVIGSNNDNKWNLTGLNIKIIITPPIWETIWFKILVVVLISAIIFSFIKLRTKRIEKQKIILSAQVEERTKQLSEKTEQLNEINKIISVQNIELKTLNESLVDKNRFIEHQNEELLLLKNDLEIKADQAEIANRSKSEFLANMSHEIRTPMNAILGFAEILSTKLKDSELTNYTSIITSSGNALLTIINDILDLSKIEAGKLELQPSYIHFRRILQEITQLFIPKVKEKGLELITEIADDFPIGIFLDEVRIRQVIMNLIGNAIKFTDKGYIKISVNATCYREQKEISYENATNSEFKSDIKITIEDTGIGIPKEQIEKIFKPFEQVDGQSTRRFGGTGLGLSISTRLIKMMGGILSVSGDSGMGSIFTIMLPNIRSNDEIEISTQIINPTELDIEFSPAKILVVDDIALNRDLVKTYLEEYNLVITIAEDGEKTLQEIKRDKYDLILLDMKMPGMSGEEVAKILKSDENTKKIPIIMLTASALKEERDRIVDIANGFLTKPIDKLRLIREIKKYLSFKEKVREGTIKPLQEELEDEKVLSVEQKEKLIQVLEKELYKEWEIVSKTKAMGSVKELAIKINKTGKEFESRDLIRYSNELLESVDLFKVIKIKNLLNEFPKIIDKIKS
jgi:signal transduction histidine kinase/CheY-like chemotaxis protein